MITELAVAHGFLADREAKIAAAERRRQREFDRTGAITIAPENTGITGKVVSFVRGFRTGQVEPAVPGAFAGDAAA